jgi:hypothetical protein
MALTTEVMGIRMFVRRTDDRFILQRRQRDDHRRARADGMVSRRYTIGADFDAQNNRGIDPYSPVWNLFDLTPAGRGDWFPGTATRPIAPHPPGSPEVSDG